MSSENKSVFIPRVFINISKERIAELFDKLDIGIVDHIDLIKKKGREGEYCAAYIHFKYWLKSTASRNFRAKLDTEEGAKLVYDDPWYWVILKNTSKGQNKTVKVATKPVPLPIAPKLEIEVVAGVLQEQPPKSAVMKRFRNAKKLKVVQTYDQPSPQPVQRSRCCDFPEDYNFKKNTEAAEYFMASL
jgi:hypothetical protein